MRQVYFFALCLSLTSSVTFAQNNTNPRQETAYLPGRILIQLSAGAHVDQVVQAVPGYVQLKPVKELSRHMRFWSLSFDSGAITHAELLKSLRGLKAVRLAQNDHYVAERATVPDDPSFGSQWHHKNTGASGGTVDADIDSDEAWDITTGGVTAQGDTIVVALVEGGGAYYQHPDLIGNFWRNYHEIPGNGIDDDGNGYTDDFNGWNVDAGTDVHASGGHGTNCMGMIAAKGNNALGVVGANWNVKVMLVSNFGISESEVISAYDYPLTMRKLYNETNGVKGAFVVSTSASWGIDNADPASYPLWCAYYDTLGVYGILSVAATTNNNTNVDVAGDMPTGCSSNYLVSATRTGNTDNQAGGYGAVCIDLGAPGINVYTTNGTSGYTSTTGTSFACPLTAGVIALMYSVPCSSFMNMVKADPQGGADYVRSALLNNVDPVASLASITASGGRLNSFKAVNAILTSCSTSPCPQPFGLTISSITTSAAHLSWTDGGSGGGFYYYYRPVGAPTWDSVLVSTNSATISGLASCTPYEVMVAADCDSLISDYTPVMTFTTDGCCTPPAGVTATVVSDTTASINFTPVTAAVSYTIQYKPVSTSTWTTVSTSSVPYTLTGLTPCENYEVQVQTVCSSTSTTFTSSVFFTTTGCGACLDMSYCASAGGSVADEYIAHVQVGTINRTSVGDGGYILTGQSTSMNRGQMYNISLTPGYSGTAFSEYFSVWIDYNQNGVFEDPAEKVYTTGAGVTAAVSGSFTVPMSAPNGTARMRVSMKYVGFGDTGMPTPCLAFGYGEVEDYCVSIDGTIGVAEIKGAEVMCMVYPNPAAASINFDIYNYTDFAGGKNYINLYNAVGEMVHTVPVNGKTTSIDLSGFSNGIYSYSINLSGKANRTGRIVVSK